MQLKIWTKDSFLTVYWSFMRTLWQIYDASNVYIYTTVASMFQPATGDSSGKIQCKLVAAFQHESVKMFSSRKKFHHESNFGRSQSR